MNETLKVINSRRSIRAYKPEQISDEDLQAILTSAIHAPSAMNQQKWHFAVVQNKELLAEMVEIAKECIMNSDNEFLKQRASAPNYHTFHQAPTVIMISGAESAPWIDIDCGMAAQNIALAAESLGLGSCIIGTTVSVFNSAKGARLKKEINMPAGYKHMCSVALGFKACENPAAPARNKEVVSYIE